MIKKINSAEDVKKLNIEEQKQLAEEIRKYILEIVSKNGGHLASNLGVVELTIALHTVFDLPKDKIVWDVGHQTYVHKIITGRREQLKTLRQLNGIAWFPKTNESETKKVFFITSNETKLDKLIEYKIPINRGIINLKAGYYNAEYKKEIKINNSSFSVYINSFEIYHVDLKEEDQDYKSKKYKIEINLRYNKTNFPGVISFRSSKNNFIYDFKFKEYKSWGRTYEPPFQITFSKLEQLKIYNEFLDKVLHKEKSEQIYSDLVTESQIIYFGKKFI